MNRHTGKQFGSSDLLNRREEIKARLRSRGVTMSDIARSLNLTPATVHAVVSGRSYSQRVAEAIASELEVNVADIWPDRTKKGDANVVSN